MLMGSHLLEEKKKPPDFNNLCLSQEEDSNKLWCLCRKPEGGQFMIQWDHCGEWLHGDCVGVSCCQGQQLEENGEKFWCPLCNPQTCLPTFAANQSALFIWVVA